MFAKAEWFSKGKRSGRVRPSGLRGWLYTVAWSAVTIVPAFLLFNMHPHRVPEAGIWLVLSAMAWRLDLRPVRSAIWRRTPADVFVIDENTDITQLNTRNYDMSLRS